MSDAMAGRNRVVQCSVATLRASRYLQQLCKHFAHKVAVTYDAQRGEAALPGGTATFEADAETLVVRVCGADEEGVARACRIIEDHLLRFAYREAPGPLSWERINT